MNMALFSVDRGICAECSLALRRFVGGLDGVESSEARDGRIAVRFVDTAIGEETVSRIAKDSIEKPGYRVAG